jgi:NADH dehydrogenase
MNLVVGATGHLGTEICRLLSEQGKPLRALVRSTADPAKLERLRSLGAELVVGNLKDGQSLRQACAGVQTIISTATVISSQQPDDSFADVDDAGQRALIDAARENGVTHFIFVSVSGNLTVSSPIIDAKRAVERYLQASELAYTILRASAFMQIWLGPHLGFDHQQHKARVLGTGEQRISYISLGDVAQFAVACVDNPSARGRIIEIGGPEPISPLQAIRVFEKVSGTPYQVEHVPVATLQAQYDAAQHPVQRSFAGLMLALAHDDVIPMADTAREFGVRQTSIDEHAAQIFK